MTIKQHLETLPPRYRELALKYHARNLKLMAESESPEIPDGFTDCYALRKAFIWDDTDEGFFFWDRVYSILSQSRTPLDYKRVSLTELKDMLTDIIDGIVEDPDDLGSGCQPVLGALAGVVAEASGGNITMLTRTGEHLTFEFLVQHNDDVPADGGIYAGVDEEVSWET